MVCYKNESAHEKTALIKQATSKGSGETAQKRSLARVFAVRRHVVETLRKLKAKKVLARKRNHCVSGSLPEKKGWGVWGSGEGSVCRFSFFF